MHAKINTKEVIPSAKRLIKSLRDLGYTFSSAISDLIDNSIQAGSTGIYIDIEMKGVNSFIRIADNGYGMTLSQLEEAMRYGSDNDYSLDNNLGKFGLGLKTASFSQCRRFSVATRSMSDRQKIIHSFAWDLAHIEKTNKWEILELDNKIRDFVVQNYLKDNTGTVVLWQYLDRVIEATDDDNKADKIILKLHRELEEHLSMVFHRFLAGEVPDSKIKIYLNDVEIIPWDPFVRNEKKTQELPSKKIPVEIDGIKCTVSLQPYILPNQDDFSSKGAFDKASGPNKWNNQQGFYIYRSNRLIQSGGWSRLRAADEHTKLARIALDFTPHLDDAFKINVAKMKVQIPQQIKDQVDAFVKPVVKHAREIYDKSGKEEKPIKKEHQVTHSPHETTHTSTGVIKESVNPVQLHLFGGNDARSNSGMKWTLKEIQSELEKIAYEEERPIIKKVFKRFADTLKN
jgi:hypothetical protein